MKLRVSQKAELGAVIAAYGLDARDFSWTKEPKGTFSSSEEVYEIVHTDSKDFFRFEADHKDDGRTVMYVTYVPSDDTLAPKTLVGVTDWKSVVSYFDNWVAIIQKESEAVDPWAEPESTVFEKNDEKGFTKQELVTVDKAIDKSMEELIATANQHGIEATLADIQEDIKYLKQQARTKSKSAWLDIFKSYIAQKLLDWGISTLAATTILQVLYEAAKPTLQLMAAQ